MYQLYFLNGACSLATQVVLRELGQQVNIIDIQQIDDFKAINPLGSVPVLVDGDKTLTEGAAIMLHLLNKHENSWLPTQTDMRQKLIQDIMFANATMHPAYSKLFFIAQNISDEQAAEQAFAVAAKKINQLWQVVETKLESQRFLHGYSPGVADIMLAVYYRWSGFFPVDIVVGERTQKMLHAVQAMPSFQASLKAEQEAAA